MTVDTGIADSPRWNEIVASGFEHFPIYLQHKNMYKGSSFHKQPGVEIHLSHTGQAAFVAGSDIYVQRSRHVMILDGQVPHQVIVQPESGYSRTVLCINPHELANERSNAMIDFSWIVKNRCLHFVLIPELYGQIKPLCDRIGAEWNRRQTGWERMLLSHVLELSVLLQRGLENQSGAEPNLPDETCLTEQCAGYIRRHLHEELSLRRVASLFSVSPEHLTRLFKQTKSLSYYQYVMLQRVLRAKDLLEERPDLSLTEIAMKVGFASSSQFTRTFRSQLNETPSAYRRNYCNSPKA
jgi:AraC-like DNA-binding protein